MTVGADNRTTGVQVGGGQTGAGVGVGAGVKALAGTAIFVGDAANENGTEAGAAFLTVDTSVAVGKTAGKPWGDSTRGWISSILFSPILSLEGAGLSTRVDSETVGGRETRDGRRTQRTVFTDCFKGTVSRPEQPGLGLISKLNSRR